MPFLMESWIGGQISVLGFIAVTLFVFCRARNHRFFAGLALALALFKPTLIATPVLMLFCGRRWRMLGGVVTGAAALRRNKYVDVGSFFHLLLGNASTLTQVLAAVAALAALAILAMAWWQSSSWSAASRDLLWAATLVGALVSNMYRPIYDTILVGPAVARAAGVMLRCAGNEREVFGGWLVLLYIVPWLTQLFAEFLRFQPLTLILAGFAWWALGRARGPGESQTDAQSERRQDIGLESSEGSGAYQTQGSTYHQLLGLTSYAVSCLTRNSGRCLSVFLRSYSPAPAILWERDR
jgi:hypothetical protein